ILCRLRRRGLHRVLVEPPDALVPPGSRRDPATMSPRGRATTARTSAKPPAKPKPKPKPKAKTKAKAKGRGAKGAAPGSGAPVAGEQRRSLVWRFRRFFFFAGVLVCATAIGGLWAATQVQIPTTNPVLDQT